MNPADVAAWFLNERGITADTLRAFGVTMDMDRGNVLFPYPNGVKERPDPSVQLPEGKRRFYFTRGQLPELYPSPEAGYAAVAFLVEGESDTMRLWQELRAGDVTAADVYGIGGINTWRPELAKRLAEYDRVYVILDNDQDYLVKEQVNNVWREIRRDVPRAKRVHLTQDAKDVCEFLATYDLETLRLLTQKSGVSRYKPVDFSLPPPPVRWLLDGWVAMGDVTILAGLGGLGKSWVTMALALAVLNGDAECLEEEVHESGRVLYVDEENPIDVVYSRMMRMGLDPYAHGTDMRFLWNQGIRLDRDADVLLDEAMDFKPTLLVMDSLSRLHSAEENAAGEIGRILNDGVKPLARETGAGVVLIHHHDKGANGPRGSTDIVNAADAVIDVREEVGGFALRLRKSRRKQSGAEIRVAIADQADGSVKLVVNPPFNHDTSF